MSGGTTSRIEVSVSATGVSLTIEGVRHELPFSTFPWFQGATIAQISRVERPTREHLRWPDLDIDLALDSIEHPELYPLTWATAGPAVADPSGPYDSALTAAEWKALEQACAAVPPPATTPAIGSDADYPDYITNVLLTVLDLQMLNQVVRKSIDHYREHRWGEIRSLDDLDSLLARFPDDHAGNEAVARYLWGNRFWNRAGWLRGLVRWLRETELTDQAALMAWAPGADFKRDFEGRAKYLGLAAFQWLRIRLGVDTIKPDVMVHRFVARAVGRPLRDDLVVKVLTEAAHRVRRRARELDGGIWEAERGGPGEI